MQTRGNQERQWSAASEAAAVGGRRRTPGNGIMGTNINIAQNSRQTNPACHSSAICSLAILVVIPNQYKHSRRPSPVVVKFVMYKPPKTQNSTPVLPVHRQMLGPSSPRARWYRKQLENCNQHLPLSKPTCAYRVQTEAKTNFWLC